MSRRNPRYTDEFRASAVVMLESQGWPERKGALSHVARHLKIPLVTLHRWAKQSRNPAPSEVVTLKRLDLKELLRAEINEALKAAPDAREFADYKDLITGAAIMIDKLQLLEGKPTDRQDVTVHDDLTDHERSERIIALLDAARTRRDGQAFIQ